MLAVFNSPRKKMPKSPSLCWFSFAPKNPKSLFLRLYWNKKRMQQEMSFVFGSVGIEYANKSVGSVATRPLIKEMSFVFGSVGIEEANEPVGSRPDMEEMSFVFGSVGIEKANEPVDSRPVMEEMALWY